MWRSIKKGEIKAEINFVFNNREPLERWQKAMPFSNLSIAIRDRSFAYRLTDLRKAMVRSCAMMDILLSGTTSVAK
jgi:hypothetical protein